ncbi:MAG: hypothetical protein D6811_12260, partial [Alphaproteobacteria bacterium]
GDARSAARGAGIFAFSPHSSGMEGLQQFPRERAAMPGFVTIHPMLVHFPIVLIMLIAGLDVFATLRRWPLGARSVIAALVAGLGAVLMISVTLAASLGHAAAEFAMARGVAPGLLIPHLTLGSIATLMLFGWALVRVWIWWRKTEIGGGRRALILVADAALVALVIATAFYGGQLVYDHGVNVAALALR